MPHRRSLQQRQFTVANIFHFGPPRFSEGGLAPGQALLFGHFLSSYGHSAELLRVAAEVAKRPNFCNVFAGKGAGR